MSVRNSDKKSELMGERNPKCTSESEELRNPEKSSESYGHINPMKTSEPSISRNPMRRSESIFFQTGADFETLREIDTFSEMSVTAFNVKDKDPDWTDNVCPANTERIICSVISGETPQDKLIVRNMGMGKIM